MKKQLVFIIAALISSAVFAQKKSDSHITGHVINKQTGDHIPFYNVSIKGTTIGAATDATGHYYIKNIPVGDFTVVASGLGYKTIEKQIRLTPSSTAEVNFEVEEDHIQIDGVVVSANRNEVNRREAPVVVNIISPKLFENTNSVCLAQGLGFQPGLRVENNCQNCGYQQVRINGLDGTYSQILIDSRPIFSSLAGVYGIEQIPANMIERVEVMRGGGSALFGSNAIGGTINIITKEPNTNSVALSNTTNLIYGKKTDVNTALNAAVVSDDFKTGAMLFGATRHRNGFDYDGDGFTEIGQIEMKNLGFRAFYKPGISSKISVEYHNLGEFRRGGNSLHLPAHEADITEQTEHNINTGSIKYDVFSRNLKHRFNIFGSAQHISRDSYYGAGKDPDAYGSTTDQTFVTGTQYSYSADTLLFMPAEFTSGFEYSSNHMLDKMLGYGRIVDQSVNIVSFFAQNEWKNTKFSFLAGCRADKHNLISNPILSPRINLRYSPLGLLSLRASYSSGFRAPQAFDEDLHITAVGGEVTLIEIDPELQPERSKSISASADVIYSFGDVDFNLLVEGFYTDLDRVFVLEQIGSDNNGNIILFRTNGKGAVVKGINVEGKVVPSAKIQFQFGMTFQKSLYKEAQKWSDDPGLAAHRTMFRSPDRYGFVTSNFNITKNFGIAISGTYTGSMLMQHYAGYGSEDTETTTPEVYDVTIKISQEFKINGSARIQINGGVQNVFNSYQSDFDKGQFRDAAYIYGPASPRSYFVGLKITI